MRDVIGEMARGNNGCAVGSMGRRHGKMGSMRRMREVGWRAEVIRMCDDDKDDNDDDDDDDDVDDDDDETASDDCGKDADVSHDDAMTD